MATVVVTRSRCDRCDKTDERPGSDACFPPVGWSTVNVQTRAPGEGWSGGGERTERLLCPDCSLAIRHHLISTVGG